MDRPTWHPAAGSTRTVTSPASVNLMAFPMRFTRICRRRPLSPRTVRQACGAMWLKTWIFFCRAWKAMVSHGLFHEPAQIEVVFVQFQLAGFDLGEVEDVVDQGQERLAAAAAGFDEAPLPLVELGVAQQFRHADDAVQGRAQLVAHRGQELALGAAGLFGLLLGQPSTPRRPVCAA